MRRSRRDRGLFLPFPRKYDSINLIEKLTVKNSGRSATESSLLSEF
jgi:hypothetical protein